MLPFFRFRLPVPIPLPTGTVTTVIGSSFSTHAYLLSLTRLSLSLPQLKQVHAVTVVGSYLPSSVSLCASLILRYGRFWDVQTCRYLFVQTLPFSSSSSFFWNTFSRVLASCKASDIFDHYNLMVRNGVRPDDYTYPFVLKACADGFKYAKGLEVHGAVFKLGFDSDVYVGNTLLLFYGSHYASLTDARKVFGEMVERDVVSWNTAIGMLSVHSYPFDAIDLFIEMRLRSPVKPNLVTVITTLPVCSVLESKGMTMIIHCYMVKAGLNSMPSAGNALIDAYGKCGQLDDSRRAFDEMELTCEVSWNSLITSLSYHGENLKACEVFREMVSIGMRPDAVTLSSIVPMLIELDQFSLGKEVHGYSLRSGAGSDVFVGNSLIDMYSKFEQPHISANLFNQMETKTVVTWNALIANYAQNKLELQAVGLVRQMQAAGESPNSVTFTNLLPACARLGLLLHGKEIHTLAIRTGCAVDLYVSNALTDLYAKCGNIDLARNVFTMSLKDQVSYNILIVGYARTADCLQSLRLFLEMKLKGIEHDVVSFMGVISACANIFSLKKGKEIHGLATRNCYHSHLFVSNSLLDLYIKCGRIDIAHRLFDRIPIKDSASWNCLISGYGMLGELTMVFSLFEEMKKDGNKCDSVTYIAVLSACSHGGFVEKGKQYFAEMQENSLEPTHIHYACMVDLLGRAGLIDEAMELIKQSPAKEDFNVWGALVGACRIHGNLKLASWAAESLFKLQPLHSGYYAVVSNMLAEAGNWDEALCVRQMLKSKGGTKKPGCSWVSSPSLSMVASEL